MKWQPIIRVLFIVVMWYQPVTAMKKQKTVKKPKRILVIRKPEDTDYQAVYTLMREESKRTHTEYLESYLSEQEIDDIYSSYESTVFKPMWEKRNDDNVCFLAAYDNKTFVGVLYAEIHDERITVKEIFIQPAYTGKNLRKELFDAMMNCYHKRNMNTTSITLEVPKNNKSAVSDYKKFGFEPVKMTMQLQLKKFVTKRVKNDGIVLNTQSLGDKKSPAIILIAGAGASGAAWSDDFCRQLAEGGYFVIRFDHRDTGLSITVDYAKNPYTIAELAGDVVKILDSYGITKAHVIGHSMGGYIAQWLACYSADRLLSITSIASGCVSGPRDVPQSPERQKNIQEATQFFSENKPTNNLEESKPRLEKIWQYMNGAILVDKEIPYAYAKSEYQQKRYPLGPAHVHMKLVEKIIQEIPQHQECVHQIKVPVLVIHGDRDPLIAVQHGAQFLAHNVPDARLLIFPGMGHVFFNKVLQQKIATAIITFYKEHVH